MEQLIALSSGLDMNAFATANILTPIGVLLFAAKILGAVCLVGFAKVYWGRYFFNRLRS